MLYPVLGWVFGWLWLCFLTWPNWGWGGGENFTFQSVQLFFRIRGLYAKKNFHKKVVLWPQLGVGPLCGGHHQKVPLFLTPPLSRQNNVWKSCMQEVRGGGGRVLLIRTVNYRETWRLVVCSSWNVYMCREAKILQLISLPDTVRPFLGSVVTPAS